MHVLEKWQERLANDLKLSSIQVGICLAHEKNKPKMIKFIITRDFSYWKITITQFLIVLLQTNLELYLVESQIKGIYQCTENNVIVH